ncbi:hypothetical protein J2I47_00535 [Fibrella sp. HMF5335]|uniref:Uncharacterized protein n=1 Tax=Fibrella rubiginis TaxID=2817060 RepID=A0A939K448_9BACT|nr:hypothetical protein [Fibrella rubiginis]MBO0935020.1 hypothetical protein [Fibrella rubiginis]
MDFSQKDTSDVYKGINSDVPDLSPVKHSRIGWEELFRKVEEQGYTPNKDLLENLPNNFDAKGWTW